MNQGESDDTSRRGFIVQFVVARFSKTRGVQITISATLALFFSQSHIHTHTLSLSPLTGIFATPSPVTRKVNPRTDGGAAEKNSYVSAARGTRLPKVAIKISRYTHLTEYSTLPII